MKIKLSPRLEAIAGCVDGTSSMADIGTDHGYLPVYLVENAMTASAIASDTNQQPLKKAEKIISELQLEKQIETRLGSGLSVLKPGEVGRTTDPRPARSAVRCGHGDPKTGTPTDE